MITYYTDGSCRPTNPGPGGFAVIRDGMPWLLGGEPQSTNIRMEGYAMLAALNDADGEESEIYSDSLFWINVLTMWVDGWKRKGWKKSSGEIANLDLVKALDEAWNNSNATLGWVKGHADDPGNIMADKYALIASGKWQDDAKSQNDFDMAITEITAYHDHSYRTWVCGGLV